MTLNELIQDLTALRDRVAYLGELPVDVRIDNSDHYASGNFEVREIKDFAIEVQQRTYINV